MTRVSQQPEFHDRRVINWLARQFGEFLPIERENPCESYRTPDNVLIN